MMMVLRHCTPTPNKWSVSWKSGTPSHHRNLNGIFPHTPSSYGGTPMTMESPKWASVSRTAPAGDPEIAFGFLPGDGPRFFMGFLIYPTEKLVLSKEKMAEPFYALKSKMEWWKEKPEDCLDMINLYFLIGMHIHVSGPWRGLLSPNCNNP